MAVAKVRVTTDLVVDAARITREVYRRNAVKLANADHPETSMAEMNRAAIMDALASDDNLCEMLAGRIHQLGHAT